jgi:hypothetical protein
MGAGKDLEVCIDRIATLSGCGRLDDLLSIGAISRSFSTNILKNEVAEGKF